MAVSDSVRHGIKCLNSDNYDIIISDMALPTAVALEFFNYFLSLCPQSLKILIADKVEIDPLKATPGPRVDEIVEKPFPVRKLLDRIVFNFNEYL